VLVAGIAGFKSWRAVENPSASFLRDWIELPIWVQPVRSFRDQTRGALLESVPSLLASSSSFTCAETVPKPHLFGPSEVAI
jgi:hypothetical protein